MRCSLALKIGFMPIVATALWVGLNQYPVKACENGSYCDHSYTAYKMGHGADCSAAQADGASQISAFLQTFEACGSGQGLCWTGPTQYDTCVFDGTQYSVEAFRDYGCGGCL